jgi:hypothetical protein
MLYRLGQVLWWLGMLALAFAVMFAGSSLFTRSKDGFAVGAFIALAFTAPCLLAAFIITGHLWSAPPRK